LRSDSADWDLTWRSHAKSSPKKGMLIEKNKSTMFKAAMNRKMRWLLSDRPLNLFSSSFMILNFFKLKPGLIEKN